MAEVAPWPPDSPLPESHSGGTTRVIFDALAQMRRDYWREVKGNSDDVTTGEVLFRESQPNQRRDVATFIAVTGNPWDGLETGANGLPLINNSTEIDPARIVGKVTAATSLIANQHLMGLGWGVYVREVHRRAGIGSALLRAAELWAKQRGRSSFLVASIGMPSDSDSAIRIRGGEIGLQPDNATRFCQMRGYLPTQIVRHQVLDVHQSHLGVVNPHPSPPGYELETYLGQTPAELRAGRIQLRMDLEADVPRGANGPSVTPWTIERLQAFEANEGRIGENLTTMAVGRGGNPVGFTRLIRPFNSPNVTFQKETIVTHAHRGHGLGRAMKAMNLIAAMELWPQIRRVNTWTAAENSHMCRINAELGFQTISVEANWIKTISI